MDAAGFGATLGAMSTEPGSAPPFRAHFVDVLRLFMAAQMIEGHTLDALLSEELRTGPVFDAWTWFRGLTAVGFLFAAGVSFSLSSLARWDAYRRGETGRRRVRRALTLVGLGYLLHFPAAMFSADPGEAAASLAEAQRVDVLQCIGVTMLVLEGIAARARTPGQVVGTSAVLALALLAFAPVTATLDCRDSAVRFACNYVSRSGGSLFPLLPWSGFLLCGVVAGHALVPRGPRASGLGTAARLAGAAVVLALLARALEGWMPAPTDPLLHAAWPPFSLVRLAGVLLLAALFATLTHRTRSLPLWARTLAGETLVLYVSHLLALYVGGVGLARTIGPTLPLGPALAVAAALAAFACALALGGTRWRAMWLVRRASAPRAVRASEGDDAGGSVTQRASKPSR